MLMHFPGPIRCIATHYAPMIELQPNSRHICTAHGLVFVMSGNDKEGWVRLIVKVSSQRRSSIIYEGLAKASSSSIFQNRWALKFRMKPGRCAWQNFAPLRLASRQSLRFGCQYNHGTFVYPGRRHGTGATSGRAHRSCVDIHNGHDNIFTSTHHPISKGDCISRVNGRDCLSLSIQDFNILWDWLHDSLVSVHAGVS